MYNTSQMAGTFQITSFPSGRTLDYWTEGQATDTVRNIQATENGWVLIRFSGEPVAAWTTTNGLESRCHVSGEATKNEYSFFGNIATGFSVLAPSASTGASIYLIDPVTGTWIAEKHISIASGSKYADMLINILAHPDVQSTPIDWGKTYWVHVVGMPNAFGSGQMEPIILTGASCSTSGACTPLTTVVQ